MKAQTYLINFLVLIFIVSPWPSSRTTTLTAPFVEQVNGVVSVSPNDQKALDVPQQVTAAVKKGARQADLDVTYIERTPRYSRYALDYRLRPGDPWGIPRLCEGTEDAKRWPDEGETVTYTAHIINKGTARSSRFHFKWLIDGTVVAQGTARALRPGAEQTFHYSTAFPASPETIEVRVEPRGAVRKEAFTINNRLTIGSHDLTISMWIEQGLYDVFNRELNVVGTRSFEDWLQAQVAWMNQRFDLSRYSVAPQGILDRVRIDKIVVAPELDADFPFPEPVCATYPADPDGFLIDGAWRFKDGDPTNAFGNSEWYERYVHEADGNVIPIPLTTPRVLGIDTGLVHELAHQLGVIDLYRADYGLFEVTDLDGQVIPREKLPFPPGVCGTLFPYPGIMFGGDTTPYRDPNYFESHTAGGMNSHYNYRRGYFGDYLFDTPAQTYVNFIDSSGDPLADVFVQFYQKYALTDTIDNEPEVEAFTDAQGRMLLPNRVPDVSVVTATGHTLRPNPFGQIFHEGSNAVMFVRAIQDGQELYGWLSLLDLNLAYWQGQTEQAEFTIQLFPPGTNSCQP